MKDLVWIDGRILPAHEAHLPVYDRGFLYGDGIFETLRTYHGQIHALQPHLDRLQLSAEQIGLELRWSADELAGILGELLQAGGFPESYIRLMVTRGVGEFGLAPDLSEDQRLIIINRPLHPHPDTFWSGGVHAITVSQTGHRRGAQAKTSNYLPNLLALRLARQAGAHEAIRINGRDHVTEGSTSNVFILRRGTLFTPDLAAGVLPGITRQLLIGIARDAGVPLIEAPIPAAWLHEATEIMLSSTLREIVSVVQLDGKKVGSGSPGSVSLELLKRYRRLCGDA